MRVFRTLLLKGLCSDEAEDGEGEGEGDIDGMKVRRVSFLWCGGTGYGVFARVCLHGIEQCIVETG